MSDANLSLGIVGLPNVGKSTLFNTLTNRAVPAENYPFCTIDPNVGVVPVVDEKFNQLVDIVQPDSVKPAVIKFVDIAGIVKGAHTGEGLGNAFLANIRETDAIVQVLRVFANDKITHVSNKIDPLDDKQTIEAELIFKDIATVEKQMEKLKKQARINRDTEQLLYFCQGLLEHFNQGKLARDFIYPKSSDALQELRRGMFLLTDKPMLYVLNVDWVEPDLAEIEKWREILGIASVERMVAINVAQEYELSVLAPDEAIELKNELGITGSAVDRLTALGFSALGLISFYTAGKKEVRSWSLKRGATARQAAAKIHSDISDNFIAAEVVNVDSFLEFGSWNALKASGKVSLEGRDYLMRHKDVVNFIHN